MTEIKLMTGEDNGSRMSHLADLQELWSFGLGILTAGSWHTELETKQAHDLEIALELLEINMALYVPLTAYAQDINNLPKNAADIKEDRGEWFKKRKA